MAKDREGRFIPTKGDPSGSGNASNLGLRPGIEADDLKRDKEITDKYTTKGEEELMPNVREMHPNRNVTKTDEEEGTEQSNMYKSRYDTPVNTPVASPESLAAELSKDDLEGLVNYHSDCCITLLLPVHAAGVEVNEQQDLIRFKTMLQEVQQDLLKKNMPLNKVEAMLKPGFDLTRDINFWHRQLQGLMVLIAEGFFKYIKLPYKIPQQRYMQRSFDVSALLPLLTNDDRFYMLKLGRRGAVLYEGDIWGMREIMKKEISMGIDDLIQNGERVNQEAPTESGSTDFHGTGNGVPTERSNISMYMDQVDDELWERVLSTQHVPLLLAGEEHLIGAYRHRSKYQHIANESLPGIFEQESISRLQEMAREKLTPYLNEPKQKALDRYYNSIATNLTSSMPTEVIPACYYERVAILFIQKDLCIWGTFNKMDNQLTLHDTMEEGDECLAHTAAVQAFLHAAEVFILDPEEMPNGAEMAALMRY